MLGIGRYRRFKRSRIAALAKVLQLSLSEIVRVEEHTFDAFSFPCVVPIPRTVKKPLPGAISCDDPILAIENLDGYVDTPEEIHCDFALRCKGGSMIGPYIRDGDVVYIYQQPEVENHEAAEDAPEGIQATEAPEGSDAKPYEITYQNSKVVTIGSSSYAQGIVALTNTSSDTLFMEYGHIDVEDGNLFSADPTCNYFPEIFNPGETACTFLADQSMVMLLKQ